MGSQLVTDKTASLCFDESNVTVDLSCVPMAIFDLEISDGKRKRYLNLMFTVQTPTHLMQHVIDSQPRIETVLACHFYRHLKSYINYPPHLFYMEEILFHVSQSLYDLQIQWVDLKYIDINKSVLMKNNR
ncbi:hypothetical protein [Vibrio casei]|uniref:hypothetical protein n=1 Tax=Vibrio casei TaxID=673372 RepID=UPI003F9CB085